MAFVVNNLLLITIAVSVRAYPHGNAEGTEFQKLAQNNFGNIDFNSLGQQTGLAGFGQLEKLFENIGAKLNTTLDSGDEGQYDNLFGTFYRRDYNGPPINVVTRYGNPDISVTNNDQHLESVAKAVDETGDKGKDLLSTLSDPNLNEADMEKAAKDLANGLAGFGGNIGNSLFSNMANGLRNI